MKTRLQGIQYAITGSWVIYLLILFGLSSSPKAGSAQGCFTPSLPAQVVMLPAANSGTDDPCALCEGDDSDDAGICNQGKLKQPALCAILTDSAIHCCHLSATEFALIQKLVSTKNLLPPETGPPAARTHRRHSTNARRSLSEAHTILLEKS